MRKRKAIYAFLTVITSLLLFSCNDNTYFSAYKHIEGDCWFREDTVCLPVKQARIYRGKADEPTVQIFIGVRYTDRFKYDDITMLAELLRDDASIVWRDTVRLSTSQQDRNGFCFKESMQPSLSFHATQDSPLYLRITHLMALNPLEGITDIIAHGEPVN